MIEPPPAQGAPSRRRLLAWGAAAPVLLASARAAALAGPAASERGLSFRHLHTGECLKTVYWAEGRYIPSSLAAVDHLLRDFRTNDVVSIDVRLLDLLFALRRRLGSSEPFHVISGYRSPATNAALARRSRRVAKKSLHMRGMAVDVRLPGRDTRAVREAALLLRRGGVGFYPRADFVHLDTGGVRAW